MKRKMKAFLSTMAIGAVSLFAVLGASCGASDWVENKINQLTCEHKNGVYTTDFVAATCTEDGMTEGTKCVDCDAWVTKGQTLKALGHKEVIVEGYAVTCLMDGKTNGKTCETCGEVLEEQRVIKAKGHDVQFIDAKAANFFEEGHTAGQGCVNCGAVYSGLTVIPANDSFDGLKEVSFTETDNTVLGRVFVRDYEEDYNSGVFLYFDDFSLWSTDVACHYTIEDKFGKSYESNAEFVKFFVRGDKMYYYFIEGTYTLTGEGLAGGQVEKTLTIDKNFTLELNSIDDGTRVFEYQFAD